MSQAKAQRAKTALDKLEGQFKAEGFKGKITSVRDVSKFVEEKGGSDFFPEDQWTKYEAAVDAVKDFSVSKNSETSITVDWVEDGGMTEMPPEEMEQEKSASKLAKKVSEMERELKSLRALKEAPAVSLKFPGQAEWESNRRYGSKNVFRSADDAHLFGLWLISKSKLFSDVQPNRVTEARKSLESMTTKGLATSPLSAGGALVPEEFMADIINHQKEYGVLRRELTTWRMGSDKSIAPMNLGGLAVYYPEEGGSLTASQLAFRNVQLFARKAIALQQLTSEVIQDSAIAIAEFTAREIAREMAKAEDTAGFTGTGLAATGGIVGLAGTFTAEADDARNLIAGDTTAAHTLADVYELVSKIGDEYLDGCAFHCTSTIKALLFNRLQGSVGGLGMAEIAGRPFDTFMGYPIITNNVMNFDGDTGGNVVDVYFGNFSKAGIFGDRKALEIDTNTDAYWTSDQVGIRGIQRYDINWYNLGTTSVPGAVAALWQT